MSLMMCLMKKPGAVSPRAMRGARFESDHEAAATKSLIHELEEDVCTIDDVLAFFESPAAASVFGAEGAKGMAEQARAHKAAGGTHCFCGACSNGKAILDIKDQLL